MLTIWPVNPPAWLHQKPKISFYPENPVPPVPKTTCIPVGMFFIFSIPIFFLIYCETLERRT